MEPNAFVNLFLLHQAQKARRGAVRHGQYGFALALLHSINEQFQRARRNGVRKRVCVKVDEHGTTSFDRSIARKC
jgi:hypothetical protein